VRVENPRDAPRFFCVSGSIWHLLARLAAGIAQLAIAKARNRG
jgi:hypothetical protein